MIINFSDLSNLREKYQNKKIVFADGTFDLFHTGEVRAFKNLKNFGEIVVIGVLSDEWVKLKKGSQRPIFSEEERLEMVDSIRYVDYAVLAKNLETNKRIPISEILQKLRPDCFVTIDPSWKEKWVAFDSLGINLEILERVSDHSTTDLIKKISSV